MPGPRLDSNADSPPKMDRCPRRVSVGYPRSGFRAMKTNNVSGSLTGWPPCARPARPTAARLHLRDLTPTGSLPGCRGRSTPCRVRVTVSARDALRQEPRSQKPTALEERNLLHPLGGKSRLVATITAAWPSIFRQGRARSIRHQLSLSPPLLAQELLHLSDQLAALAGPRRMALGRPPACAVAQLWYVLCHLGLLRPMRASCRSNSSPPPSPLKPARHSRTSAPAFTKANTA
jgi:hypothetical protein